MPFDHQISGEAFMWSSDDDADDDDSEDCFDAAPIPPLSTADIEERFSGKLAHCVVAQCSSTMAQASVTGDKANGRWDAGAGSFGATLPASSAGGKPYMALEPSLQNLAGVDKKNGRTVSTGLTDDLGVSGRHDEAEPLSPQSDSCASSDHGEGHHDADEFACVPRTDTQTTSETLLGSYPRWQRRNSTSSSSDGRDGLLVTPRRNTSKTGIRPCSSTSRSNLEGEECKNSASIFRAAKVLVPNTVDEVQFLRVAREKELTAVIMENPYYETESHSENLVNTGNDAGSDVRCRVVFTPAEQHVGSPAWLRVCGVLLQKHKARHVYRYSILVLTLAIFGIYVEQSCAMSEDDYFRFEIFSELVLTMGSVLGILACRGLCKTDILGGADAMLVTYARRQEVVDQWSVVAAHENMVLILLWVGSVLCRGLAVADTILPWKDGFDWRETLAVSTFTCTSFFFVSLVYCISHIVFGLVMLVDAYCFYVVEEEDIERYVTEWNMLQAVLRKASSTVETGFLVLQTTVLLYVLLTMTCFLIHGLSIWWMLSMLILVLCDARLFYAAAQVTEKCSRVPPLINSLSFGRNSAVDERRHYLVEYVTYSAAGFYVCEVRLTAAMALKLSYISVIAAFGILTKLTTGN